MKIFKDITNKFSNFSKLQPIAFFLILAIATYTYLFGGISYTADKCRTEYSASGTSITVAPGDPIGSIIYGHGIYLTPGKYVVRIDGYNEYDEYNRFQLYSDTQEKEYAAGVFVPGMDIEVDIDEITPDFETRVGYQDAGTVEVSKVSIHRVNTVFTYIKTLIILAIIIAGYLLLNKYREALCAKIIKVVLDVICLVGLILFQLIFIEALYYNDSMYYELQQWILASQKESYLLPMSLIILAIVDGLIVAICKYFSIALPIITVLSGTYSLIGYNYYLARGEAFTFDQLQLAGEAANVLGEYNIIIPDLFWKVVVASIFVSIVIIGKKLPGKIYVRLVFAALAVFAITKTSAIVKKTMANHGDETVIFVASSYYDRVGYLVGTFVSIPAPTSKPEGYSQKAVESIIDGYNSADAFEPEETPDIIYIQCESLFDLTKVRQMTWSENPLEYLYTLSEECYVGNLVSPMVGGGTANVEYEMLTGYNYYNTNGTPFVNGLKRDEKSLVSDLNDYGYDTVVIHTNVGSFYNRDTAYTNLGMDRMIFEEQLGQEPAEYTTGVWANDLWAYEALIDDYENRDSSLPYFAQVVTTQNHGAYDYDYDKYGIEVNGDISINENRQLQTYLNLEKESMESFKLVLDYFSNVDNDVIIVFYGDHCPALSYFGISGDTMDYNIAIHETPLVVWNNYGAELSFDNSVSAYKFTSQLMKQLGFDSDNYMNYENSNDVPTLIGGTMAVFDDGSYVGIDGLPEEMQTTLSNLWMLQYDRVYGKKYSYKLGE